MYGNIKTSDDIKTNIGNYLFGNSKRLLRIADNIINDSNKNVKEKFDEFKISDSNNISSPCIHYKKDMHTYIDFPTGFIDYTLKTSYVFSKIYIEYNHKKMDDEHLEELYKLLSDIIVNGLDGKPIDYDFSLEKLSPLHQGYLYSFLQYSLNYYMCHEFGHFVLYYTQKRDNTRNYEYIPTNNTRSEYLDAKKYIENHQLIKEPIFNIIVTFTDRLSIENWADELAADYIGLKIFNAHYKSKKNIRIKYWSIFQSVFFLYPLHYYYSMKLFSNNGKIAGTHPHIRMRLEYLKGKLMPTENNEKILIELFEQNNKINDRIMNYLQIE